MAESTRLSGFDTSSDDEPEKESRQPYPPYNCQLGWMKKFLELPRVMKIPEVNRDFIGQYVQANNHQSKILNAVKFLQLVDAEGKPTDKLQSLNSEGEQWKHALELIVKGAYANLFDTVHNLEKVKPETINAFFASQQGGGLTLEKAKTATLFFAWLASEAGITLSPELQAITPSVRGESKPRREKEPKPKGKSETPREEETDEEQDVPDKDSSVILKIPTKQAGNTTITATINMTLDKETPVEVWNMIAKLLGLESEEKTD